MEISQPISSFTSLPSSTQDGREATSLGGAGGDGGWVLIGETKEGGRHFWRETKKVDDSWAQEMVNLSSEYQ